MKAQQNKHSENIFVVETCQNCSEHRWNTRHDEAKYSEFFTKVAAIIVSRIPNAMVMKNQIPKSYLEFEIYNNLVMNLDEDMPYYQQVPRTGAFEVSYRGILISSKLKEGRWPKGEEVVAKCSEVVVQMGDWPTESVAAQSYKKRLSEFGIGGGSPESALRGADLGAVGLNPKLKTYGNSEGELFNRESGSKSGSGG
jgi:hypothetical protein